jgi:hypothetical protein
MAVAQKRMSFTPNVEEQRRAYNLAIRCIRNVPRGQWIKAGTLGSHVSAAMGAPGSWNKPAIKQLLASQLGNGTIYKLDPSLGYQPIESPESASDSSGVLSTVSVEKTQLHQKPSQDPIGTGAPQRSEVASTVSVVSVVKDVFFCSDGSVTRLAVPHCTHRVLETTLPHSPSCVMCGIRFVPTKQLSSLFSHPSVMEAVSNAFSEMKM